LKKWDTTWRNRRGGSHSVRDRGSDVRRGLAANLTLLEIAKLKSAATAPKLTLAPDVPAPARVLKAPISKLVARAETVGPLALAHAIAFREPRFAPRSSDRHARRNLRLGNAHPDRRNSSSSRSPSARIPRRRNHPSFRMQVFTQQVSRAAASCRCQALARTKRKRD